MAKEMGKWSIDLSKYAEKAGEDIVDVQKTFAFMLFSSIVRKTPVDTGRARGNWQISVGSPASEIDRTDKKKKGTESAYNKVEKEKLNNIHDGEDIYISNNLPYIGKLEYGYSKQAPQGMVGVTLANAEAYYDKAIAAVKARKSK